MGNRQIVKQALIEDVHINLKRENQKRAINKAQSESLIIPEERVVKRLKRDSKKMSFETYQEMSTFFGQEDDGVITEGGLRKL